MLDAYIFAGLRTPFGRHGGALVSVRPDDLAAHVIRELLARYAIPGDAIEDVILGNANQAGEGSRNIARHATPRCAARRFAGDGAGGRQLIACVPVVWLP